MRISVLVPCYNAAPYIGAALDSVLQQDWADLEVIVVDDGSTDGSDDILGTYKHHRLKTFRQKNLGQCAAANRAYREATGDYIKFFDADDVMLPGMLRIQAERLGSRPDAVAMGEWSRFFQNPQEASFTPRSAYRDAHATEWLASEWVGGEPMMQCALWLIPRAVLEKSGPWDERLSLINDFEFFTRVLLNARNICYTPGARLAYRSGVSGSLSGWKSRKAVESQYLSLMLGASHLLAAEDSPRTRRACANILQCFDFEHFPKHADLRKQIRRRVAGLGGADINPPGPPGFQALRRVVGWKAARLAQRVGTHLHLNRAARQRAVASVR